MKTDIFDIDKMRADLGSAGLEFILSMVTAVP